MKQELLIDLIFFTSVSSKASPQATPDNLSTIVDILPCTAPTSMLPTNRRPLPTSLNIAVFVVPVTVTVILIVLLIVIMLIIVGVLRYKRYRRKLLMSNSREIATSTHHNPVCLGRSIQLITACICKIQTSVCTFIKTISLLCILLHI